MGTSTTASFLATMAVHATLWFVAAWGLARALRSAVWRARLWRGAALGGVLSAGLALALDTTRLEWSWTAQATPVATRAAAAEPAAAGAPIVLTGAAQANAPTPAVGSVPPTAPTWTWSEVAVGLWALGALVALARMARDRRRLARALAVRRPLADPAWRADLHQLARSAGLAPVPRLSVADGLSSPLALARGEVVVPARALRDLARDEQRALLAHELAHLARRDPHWLAALGVVERVFWFQPLLRTASRRASAAAELCCDEAAAHWTGAGVALARCLASVAGWIGARAPERIAVAMAARGSALVERVERLLAPQRARAFEGAACATLALALLAALACSGPTAREAEGVDPAVQAEVLRQRIDPDGSKEVSIEFLGGSRFEVKIPPSRIEALREEARQREQLETLSAIGYVSDPDDAPSAPQVGEDELVALTALGYIALPVGNPDLTRALDLLDDCPEAGIAFHVSYRDGRYAASVKASTEHSVDLRGDGSIWCGDMLLTGTGQEDRRLLDFHLQEIARCARALTADPDHLRIQCDLHLHGGASFDQLRAVLQSAARPETAITRFRFLRYEGDRVVDSLPYALPVDSSEAPTAMNERLEVRLSPSSDAAGARRVTFTLECTHGSFRVNDIDRAPAAMRIFLEQTCESCTTTAIVDAAPGVRYAEVRTLLDALIEVGFTDIRFVGRR